MTKLFMLMLFFLITSSSCINTPIVLTLSEEIEIKQADLKQVADDVSADLLKKIPLTDGTDVALAQECKNRFTKWLKDRFDEGFVPADIVPSSEYMRDSTHADKHKCLPVDIPAHYEKSLKLAKPAQMIGFDFAETAKAFKDINCSEAFLDPKKKKMKITGIDMNVIENTMSVELSKMEIYASPNVLADADLNRVNAKDLLIDEKKITLLANTEPVEPKITGKKALALNSNAKELKRAQDAIIPLEGQVLMIPGKLTTKIRKININGRDFYVVPKGGLRARMIIYTDILFQLSDAKCALNKFYEEIEKEGK